MTFDSTLHDLIGDYNEEYFDSQQLQEREKDLSCEELEEDEIEKGDNTYDEGRTLEELWRPTEGLHNMGSLQREHKESV